MSDSEDFRIHVPPTTQIRVLAPNGRPLLTITRDGEWIMDETDAPEAARVLVTEVRRLLGSDVDDQP